jgi:hypothetical protein
MVEGTATTTVTRGLRLWETVVTPQCCNTVAISAVLHYHTWMPYRFTNVYRERVTHATLGVRNRKTLSHTSFHVATLVIELHV